jgi:hypothetical protein
MHGNATAKNLQQTSPRKETKMGICMKLLSLQLDQTPTPKKLEGFLSKGCNG